MLIYLDLEQKTPVPKTLIVSPTGLKEVAQYLRGLIEEGLPRWSVETIVSVDKTDDRTPYGAFRYEMGDKLDSEKLAIVAPMVKMFKEMAKVQQSFRGADLGGEEAAANY